MRFTSRARGLNFGARLWERKIPALGKHYSQRWAQEDLLEEQKEGARANDKKKSLLGGPLSELDAKGQARGGAKCEMPLS